MEIIGANYPVTYNPSQPTEQARESRAPAQPVLPSSQLENDPSGNRRKRPVTETERAEAEERLERLSRDDAENQGRGRQAVAAYAAVEQGGEMDALKALLGVDDYA